MVIIQDIDLIKQFVDKYNSAQASIDGHDIPDAKKKYKDLLNAYHAIQASKLDKMHKELAYEQVLKVYKGVHSVKITRRFIKAPFVIAAVILLLSVVVFIKPEIVGLVFEPGVTNTLPVWAASGNVLAVRAPETRYNLDNYFVDKDGDALSYLATAPSGVNVEIQGSYIVLRPAPGLTGPRETTIVASDGYDAVKQRVTLNVVYTQQAFNLLP